MIRRPPRSTQSRSSAASDVYKRQIEHLPAILLLDDGFDIVDEPADASIWRPHAILECELLGEGSIGLFLGKVVVSYHLVEHKLLLLSCFLQVYVGVEGGRCRQDTDNHGCLSDVQISCRDAEVPQRSGFYAIPVSYTHLRAH